MSALLPRSLLPVKQDGRYLPGQFLAAGQDVGGVLAVERELGEVTRLAELHAPYDEFNLRHEWRGDA